VRKDDGYPSNVVINNIRHWRKRDFAFQNRLIALPCNLRYDDNDDDDDDGDGVFEDDYFGRENDETDYIVDDGKENETAVQDLSLANYMFNKAGCGVTNDETYFIETVMNHLSNRVNFKSVRYRTGCVRGKSFISLVGRHAIERKRPAAGIGAKYSV